MTWAKYFYDELVCQSLGSTLLVFVSNFPSFMSIGRKQHNGYQLLTFLLLTVPHPSPPSPLLQAEIKMSTSVPWPGLAWAGGAGQVREPRFPNTETYYLVASFLTARCWCCSEAPANSYWVCTEWLIVKTKLPNWRMSWWFPMTFIIKIQDQQRSLQSSPQIFTQLFNAFYKVHFLIYFLQQLRILRRWFIL